jgi:hypothetical protein
MVFSDIPCSLAAWMTLAIVSLFVMASLGLTASDWLTGTPDQQLKTLANIMPGLGTVMIEYANRMTNAYYAASGGNWDLAAYMIKEAREIQEVGETTRPGRVQALKAFEQSYLDPLDKAVKAKGLKAFKKAFNDAVESCNGRHTGQGFPYIKYVLPKQLPASLSMKR